MNLLVTGAFGWSDKELKLLENAGHHVMFMQWENAPLPCDAAWVEGVVCNGLFLNHPIEAFTNLRYIQLTSVGFDRVPMEYIEKHGIRIFNAKGVYSIPMSEFALSGVLQLYKQSKFFQDNQEKHRWEKHRGLIELFGKTVCMVGCGNVGSECAKRFKAFGCYIASVDINPYPSENYDEMSSIDDIDEALRRADIVVLTLPLTDKTRNLFDSERFSVMKKGAILVNIARGAIVDTNALLKALDTHLSGAVLDVFENEPLEPDSPLWNADNVIITPHNSFVGDGNQNRLWNIILNNLESMGE